MNGLFILLFIPLCIALAFYIGSILWGKRHYNITWQEFYLQVGAIVLIMLAGYGIAHYQSTYDEEIWNAQVAKKERKKVSCSHSYSCHCRTVSCGKNCSTTHCDTCYEHSFDVSWFVYTTAGETFTIDRINRQGTQEPPRWTQVKIGDPTAIVHSYTNYIKASPFSLLNKTEEQNKYPIPKYPLHVYDYHYINRFVHEGELLDRRAWNADLQQLNSSLGVQKQVNIVVVVTPHPESFSHALQNAWLGGKKNDVIVVIGSQDNKKIDWVRILSWSHSELLKVELRDDILEIGTLEKRAEIITAIKNHVETGFVRMEMKDYEYLLASASPSHTAMLVLILLGTCVSIGLSWYFYHEDVI